MLLIAYYCEIVVFQFHENTEKVQHGTQKNKNCDMNKYISMERVKVRAWILMTSAHQQADFWLNSIINYKFAIF